MDDRSELAVRVVDEMERVGGRFPGYRRAHARGLCFAGVFTPSGEARTLTTAAHLQAEPVPATIRFSNASADPHAVNAGSARGMAVKFHLPDGTDTDVVAVSLSRFLAPTPEVFLELLGATERDPATGNPDPTRARAFLAAHPECAAGLQEARSLASPVSYATERYSALHAFTLVNAGGLRQSVRYRWEPDAGVATLSEQEAAGAAPQYLAEALTRRLEEGPVGFSLHLQLAAEGDPTNDSTRPWPSDRRDIVAGRLEVTGPVGDQLDDCERRIFDPTSVTAGIECSDDPVLNFRPLAYDVSYRRRGR